MSQYLKYFLIPALCFNQATAQLLPFKTYSTKDGLINNQVTAVIRDELGLLWIGTPFGINWFDGNRFKEPPIKTLSGQLYITNFFKDSQKNIWVLSFYNGLYKYKDFIFTNFLLDPSIASNSNNVFDMAELENNSYLVATDQNIFRFDGKTFSVFDTTNKGMHIQFNSIGYVQDRWMFFGCSKGVFIYIKENGKWKFARTSLVGFEINRMIIEKNAQVWIATNKGLLFFDNADQVITEKATQVLFTGKPIPSITRNEQTGHLWISSDKFYPMTGDQVRSLDVSTGLPPFPGKIYFDRENIAWICTGNGIVRLGNENSLFYDLSKGPTHSMVNMIASNEKNEIWFATFDGLGQKKDHSFKDHRFINNNRIGYVAWFHKTKQNVLMAGTAAGILQIENNQITLKHTLATTKFYEDEEGVIWLTTENGRVFKLHHDSLQEILLDPFLPDFIDAVYKDEKDSLWIGYRGSGIRKYALDNNNAKLVDRYAAETGYNDLRIRCSYTDSMGNILFGTRTNGVFIISSSGKNKTWHFTTANGLSANWVKSIAADQHGTIYMATNKGVNILSGSYDQPFIRKLNLFNEDIADAATTIYPDNEKIWIGTETGLIEYFPKTENTKLSTPKVFITEFSINGKMDSTLPPYVSTAHKKLMSGNTTIAFEFAGIHLSDDAPLQYRYKLEGQDADWTYSGARNFVSYNLPAGHYTFKAEARNPAGSWSKQAASFSLIIPAPFWKTWWFLAAIILLASALFFVIYRYRVQQSLKLERLRSRISTDLHDDIGSTLSSISILSDIAAREKDQHQSGTMMQEIKHSSVSLMEKMDDIVWSINPRNDSIEDLMLRIKRFASKLFEAKEIDYTISIDDSIHKAKLDMETRQHIYLIMKEAINNLVKYSNCTKACIKVNY
ncbi:MAG TPA: two-component regulator propeller domain-containing protein, partial [Chitinophagaceae bacterium]|nr:two-component regulator propeller domain-containing protein [Chitinophagaceae bacterium]